MEHDVVGFGVFFDEHFVADLILACNHQEAFAGGEVAEFFEPLFSLDLALHQFLQGFGGFGAFQLLRLLEFSLDFGKLFLGLLQRGCRAHGLLLYPFAPVVVFCRVFVQVFSQV